VAWLATRLATELSLGPNKAKMILDEKTIFKLLFMHIFSAYKNNPNNPDNPNNPNNPNKPSNPNNPNKTNNPNNPNNSNNPNNLNNPNNHNNQGGVWLTIPTVLV
jgi:DNA mismatch repair ATPase MutL